MGVYVYKVTTKQCCLLKNREIANVSEFAYKISYAREKENTRNHFRSGCYHHDQQADLGKRSRWVLHGGGETVMCFDKPVGSYTDDDYTFKKYHVKL